MSKKIIIRNLIIILLLLNVEYSDGQVKQTTLKDFEFYSPFNADLRRYFKDKWNINIPKYLPCFAYNDAGILDKNDPYYKLTNSTEDNRVFCTWKNGEDKPVKAYYWTEPIYNKNNILDSVFMSVVIQETDSTANQYSVTPIRRVLVRFTRNQPLIRGNPPQYQVLPKSVATELQKMPDYYKSITGNALYKTIVISKNISCIYRITITPDLYALAPNEKKLKLDFPNKYTKSIENRIIAKYKLAKFPESIKILDNNFSSVEIYASNVKLENNLDAILLVCLSYFDSGGAYDQDCRVAEIIVRKSIFSEEFYNELVAFLTDLNRYDRFINFGSRWDYLF